MTKFEMASIRLFLCMVAVCLSVLLIAASCFVSTAKRPAMTSGAGGYRLHSSSPTFLSSSLDTSRGPTSLGLPFIEHDIVESYLERINGYVDRKKRMLKSIPQETNLKNALVFNEVYDRTSRPVRSDRSVVVVKAGISLYHVLDIDEKLQLLSCVIAIRLTWVDEYLQWLPAEWNNISSILMPSNLIWLPDVVVLNNADVQHRPVDTNVIVSSDGLVLWMYPNIVKSYCYLDLRWFPFDEQKCEMLMSPLSYDLRQVNFTASASNNASYYDERGQEWTVVSILASRIENFEPLSKRKFARIIFIIRLKRKALFYLYTCVFPCMLIYFVTLLSFFVPVTEQGGKIELPLTSLLSIVVLMMTIADTLAATDTVPLISRAYAWTMVQCCTSLVLNAVVMVIGRQKATRPIPPSLILLSFPMTFIRRRLLQLANTEGARHFIVVSRQSPPSAASSSMSSTSSTSSSSLLMAAAKRYYLNKVARGEQPVNSRYTTSSGSPSTSNETEQRSTSTCGSSTTCAGTSTSSPCWTRANTSRHAHAATTTTTTALITSATNETPTKTLEDSQPEDDLGTTIFRIGRLFFFCRNKTSNKDYTSTQWERIAKRINSLFLGIFLILTIVGYGMCIPSP